MRAREAQADAFAEEIIDIADTPLERERVEEGSNKDGVFGRTVREDMLGHRRLQVDTRRWLMAKLQPKKYGNPASRIMRALAEQGSSGRARAIGIQTRHDRDIEP